MRNVDYLPGERNANLAAKRTETILEKIVWYIADHPGCQAADLKPGWRRLLKEAEQRGLVEYRNDGWYRVAPL